PEFDDGLLLLPVSAPSENAALIDRVQRVDDRDAAREGEAGRPAALAEALEQLDLGLAGEPGGDEPCFDLVDVLLVHAAILRHRAGTARENSVAPFPLSQAWRGKGFSSSRNRRADAVQEKVRAWARARSRGIARAALMAQPRSSSSAPASLPAR